MRVVDVIVVAGWAAFWIYWFAAAFTMKRGHSSWSHELGIRAVIIVLVLVLVRVGVFRHDDTNNNPWLAGVGLVLFVMGLAFAMRARRYIGRNWGMPMSEKKNPELVTTGPYRLVRHPIYSGILLAGIGTSLAVSWVGLIVVALAGIFFGYSAVIEERFLARSFPDSYPEYKRATNMLVPFLY